jgi:hypothetical protein
VKGKVVVEEEETEGWVAAEKIQLDQVLKWDLQRVGLVSPLFVLDRCQNWLVEGLVMLYELGWVRDSHRVQDQSMAALEKRQEFLQNSQMQYGNI